MNGRGIAKSVITVLIILSIFGIRESYGKRVDTDDNGIINFIDYGTLSSEWGIPTNMIVCHE